MGALRRFSALPLSQLRPQVAARCRAAVPSRAPVSATPPQSRPRPFATAVRAFAAAATPAPAPASKAPLPVSLSDSALSVSWPAEGEQSTFHYLWLRDHCRCPECYHPITQQRQVDTFKIPADIRPAHVDSGEEGLTIDWEGGHTSSFTWSWLRQHSYYPKLPTSPTVTEQRSLWDHSISFNPPVVSYQEVMGNSAAIGTWTSMIAEHGFAYVEGTPTTPEATEELLEKIGCVRNTHYGAFWDFTADLTKADTAYTDLEIGLHTDTTYFSDPAGLQMFHLLHFDGHGGESLFVDGFNAATKLRMEDPEAYELLRRIPIPAHCAGNEDVYIQPVRPSPIIQVNATTGDLEQIRWNNHDRSTLDSWENPEDVARFYSALAKWNEILNRPDMVYQVQLKPGRPIIFDNWRVLHGRTAFKGNRRLCGGYINRDDYVSCLKLSNHPRGHLLEAV